MTETAWGVFCSRGDHSTPKLCRLMENTIYFDMEEAVVAKKRIEKSFDGAATSLGWNVDELFEVRRVDCAVGEAL